MLPSTFKSNIAAMVMTQRMGGHPFSAFVFAFKFSANIDVEAKANAKSEPVLTEIQS